MKLATQSSLRGLGSGKQNSTLMGMICLRKRGLPSLTDCYRLPGFVSRASAAESFRSRCGSVRGAPVCSSQASPAAAPQVVQGTDNISFGVSSLVFTII
jgi:hypothetical protein